MNTSDELTRRAYRIADGACIADIETGSVPQTDEHGQRWYDIRPMLDPRELSDPVVDMNRVALDYALLRCIVVVHPAHSHLVRIIARGLA